MFYVTYQKKLPIFFNLFFFTTVSCRRYLVINFFKQNSAIKFYELTYYKNVTKKIARIFMLLTFENTT